MRVGGYIPSQEVQHESETNDLKTVVDGFRDRFGPDAKIEYVDDQLVVAICEACLLPILEDEARICDCTDEGLQFHERCTLILKPR